MAANPADFAKYRSSVGALVSGGEPPQDGGVNERVAALEAKLEATLPNLATKGDIEGVRGDIKGWMLATVLTIIGSMLAIGLFIKPSESRPISPPVAVTAPAPVIVQVPYPVQAPPAAAPSVPDNSKRPKH
ncbi:hypothetical protein [Dyella japonica]|uniref:Uncharacterized protein n=1 Tax=Dyella japonica TaxID=231455 RepID=A0ABV2JYZ5_9GAMM